MTPTELRALLRQLGVSPKRSLGQNFLIDGNILRKIIQLADLQPGETVVEIGPGPGALTQELLKAGCRVIAIEKDREFAKALERFDVEVHCDDALTYHWDFPAPVKVVANLPYNVATPLITRLLPKRDLFTSLTVMVQDEVARRFTAEGGSKDRSSISVYVQFYSDVTYGFKVSRNCFYPAPNVDSAMVRFDLREPPEVDEEAFFAMVRAAFQQRRKMLRSSIGATLFPTLRPQDLTQHQWLAMLFPGSDEVDEKKGAAADEP